MRARLTRILAALGVAALATPGALLPQEEPEERKAWDQARVLELSDRLAGQLGEIRQTFRRESAYANPAMLQQRASGQFADILKALEQSTKQLRERVEKGEGYEETLPVARKIGSLLRDADVQGSKLFTSSFMTEKVRPAMQTLNELAPYYGSGPLYDPETGERVS